MAFTHVEDKSAKCFCLLPAVLVSWSYTSGLGLGLKILVLFPTLAYISVHIRKQHSINEVIAYEYCVVVRESV